MFEIDNNTMVTIIFVVLIPIAVFLLFVLKATIDNAVASKKETIKEFSVRYKKLTELNMRMEFFDFEAQFTIRKEFKTKAEFDKATNFEILSAEIKSNPSFYNELIAKINHNINLNYKYLTSYAELKNFLYDTDTSSLGIDAKKFQRIESRLFKKEKLSPKLDVEILCWHYFMSATGNRFYRKDVYNFEDLKAAIGFKSGTGQQSSGGGYRDRKQQKAAAPSHMALYICLGVKKTATQEEIKIAYRKLAKKYHPDIDQHKQKENTEKMIEINKAYEILSDPERRRNYDDYGIMK